MFDSASRTFICSVVFVDLAGYSKKVVTEQIRLKARLTSDLAEALKGIPADQRIVLDTGDGAAIGFLGDPEDALFVTLGLWERMGREDAAERRAENGLEQAVRMGINLGPVKLCKDVNGHPNVIGDGINVAQRIMSFAQPGQIAVSRSYYDMVSKLSADYAQLFHYEGSHTDKHVRDHEIYIASDADGAVRIAQHGLHERRLDRTVRTALAPRRIEPPGGITLSLTIPGFARDRPTLRAIAGTLAVVVAVLAVLVTLRKPVASVPARGLPAAAARSSAANAVAVRAGPPAAQSAKVLFSISPWGSVFVNGQARGASPPLKSLQLAPGRHVIEVTNTAAAPYVEIIEVKPRQEVVIRHTFQ